MRGGLLLSALLGVLIGALALVLLRPAHEPAAIPPPAASDPRIAELVSALERIEHKLAQLERPATARESTSERAPVALPEGEADPLPLTATQELHDDLRQLEARLDMLTAAWKEHDKPTFELPTLEQVHAARRDVDWVWLGELAELFLKDEDAALEKARLMTFEQLLKRAGVPNHIAHDNGTWMYFRPEHVEGRWRGLYFTFVGDCVSSVRTGK